MQSLFTLFSKEALSRLKRHQLFSLILVYRWLALVPPAFALLLAPADKRFSALFYTIAVSDALLQTLVYLKICPLIKKTYIYTDDTSSTYRVLVGFFIVIGLLVSVFLNSMESNSYFLYSLSSIFSCAFFYGPVGSLASALIIGSGYLAAKISAILVAIERLNWSVELTFLAFLFVAASLSGYLMVISDQLRKYAVIIERYRGTLEQQNQSLEQTNHQLEYLSDFNRVLKQGSTLSEVEHLAVNYLARLLVARTSPFSPAGGRVQNSKGPVQILTGQNLEEWFAFAHEVPLSQVLPGQRLTGNTTGVIEFVKDIENYWVVNLVYKEEPLGALVLLHNSNYARTGSKLEIEEKLLVSLLGEQLANHLGSLKQNQALAVEAERARLAMDMHDIVAQSLFGIAYNLDGCLKLLNNDPEGSYQRLSSLKSLAFETLGSVRAIINDLSNEEETEVDFVSFLDSYLKNAGKLYPFKIYLNISGLPEFSRSAIRFDREVQKNLYRIIHETLSNTAKHSQATEVNFAIFRKRTEVRLVISDNGIGFQVQKELNNGRDYQNGAVKKRVMSSGMGIKNVQERAKQAGISLAIESAPGSGTRVILDVPIRD
ncbi:MAG: multi-sensor signal transduction histidine kinase [Chloroflexi bacterium]|nr:multi-sensor signal transduction histidine kinase [Chloroflexota bacterium]